MSQHAPSIKSILLIIVLCLLGTVLFDTTAQHRGTDAPAPMIIRVDKHNAVNTLHICNYYIEATGTPETAKLYADLTNGTRVKLCTGTTEQCEACLDRIVSAITPKLVYYQLF